MDGKLNHKNQSSKTSKTQNCNGKTPKILKAIASIKPYNNQKCSTNSISSPTFSSPKRKKEKKKKHTNTQWGFLELPETHNRSEEEDKNQETHSQVLKNKKRKHLQLNWGHPAFTFLEGLQKRKHKKRRGNKKQETKPTTLTHSNKHSPIQTHSHPYRKVNPRKSA